MAEPTAEQTAEASVLAAQGPKPSEVMRSLMQAAGAEQLTGEEISLSDAVRQARSRQDQTQRAQAYWALSAAVGEYRLALRRQNDLAILRQGLTSPGEQWNVHQQQAASRIESTRRAAIAAQVKLQQLLGRPSTSSLPLPGDAPHCGRYNAEYEEIFASRPDPVARELSALMPLRYAELRAQAQEIVEAEGWRDQARQRWSSAQDDLQLLNAQDLVCLKRRAFLDTARQYNQEIAAYTELAAPAVVAPDRLVAMMIRTSTSGGSAFPATGGIDQASAMIDGQAPGAVQQAGGTPLESRPQQPAGRPQTFAEESRTEARKPVRRLFDSRERSIISAIRRLPHRLLDRD
ncbi:MAG: hypothetical protein IT424_06380 [Pirellulales bacterium]|nr:hypothetical protein [Pirellulales bacterium]